MSETLTEAERDWRIILAARTADLRARLAAAEALVREYAPTIKMQLECAERTECGCTFCDFVDDLRAALAPGSAGDTT